MGIKTEYVILRDAIIVDPQVTDLGRLLRNLNYPPGIPFNRLDRVTVTVQVQSHEDWKDEQAKETEANQKRWPERFETEEKADGSEGLSDAAAKKEIQDQSACGSCEEKAQASAEAGL